jgi:hypothetical protein
MRTPCLVQAARFVQLQTTFLTHVLPRVEAHGRIYFRHVKCPHKKEELGPLPARGLPPSLAVTCRKCACVRAGRA